MVTQVVQTGTQSILSKVTGSLNGVAIPSYLKFLGLRFLACNNTDHQGARRGLNEECVEHLAECWRTPGAHDTGAAPSTTIITGWSGA